jgi:hypothetical protein
MKIPWTKNDMPHPWLLVAFGILYAVACWAVL